MNMKRISLLLQPQVKGMIKLGLYSSPLLLISIVLSTPLVVQCNGRILTILGVVSYTSPYLDTEEALLYFFRTWFSWAYYLILFYPILGLLVPLARSSWVSQTLWLRMTSSLPYEVALARVLWVIAWAIWLSIPGAVWALTTTWFHHITLNGLLIQVWGLVSLVIFMGGIVSVMDFGTKSSIFGSFAVVIVSIVFPLIFALVYLAIPQGTEYMKLFPHSIPYAEREFQNQLLPHYTTTAISGLIFLCIHVATKLRYSKVDSIHTLD